MNIKKCPSKLNSFLAFISTVIIVITTISFAFILAYFIKKDDGISFAICLTLSPFISVFVIVTLARFAYFWGVESVFEKCEMVFPLEARKTYIVESDSILADDTMTPPLNPSRYVILLSEEGEEEKRFYRVPPIMKGTTKFTTFLDNLGNVGIFAKLER